MSFFRKLKHHIGWMSLRSKFAALHISSNKKQKVKLLMINNYSSKKVDVATPSVLDKEEDENYFTPSEDLEGLSNSEIEDSSYVCEICVEQRPLDDSFDVKGCSHFYCIECTVSYIKSKLEDNITLIPCPQTNCEGVLEPDFCRYILPSDLFYRWGKALCESAVIGSEQFYCPYKDCSALLIKDSLEVLMDSTCPFCNRIFCVQCKVAWHTDMDCKKFQKLKKLGDDAMLVDLAKRKKWRQCPKCNYYVEKSIGCDYVRCRCGYAFCYNCGARSSRSSHRCPICHH